MSDTAEFDPITDTGRVAASVAAKVREKLAQDVEAAVKKALQEHDTATRSFWRAVFDALWSGVTQAHAALHKIMK